MKHRRSSNTLGLGGPEPIDRPRRKPPRPLRTAVLALVVLGLVVAWMRYDPIGAPGPPSDCPEGATEIPAAAFDDADVQQFPDRSGICVVRNVDMTRATVVADIHNDAPIGVRVTGVRVTSVPGVFDVEEVALTPSEAPADPDSAEPIDGSASLPGDTRRLLAVTLTLPDCRGVERARVATLDALPLRVRVLGLPRDVDLPLDPVLRVQAEFCP